MCGSINYFLHISQPIRWHKSMISIGFWTCILPCLFRHSCFHLCILSELEEIEGNGQKMSKKCFARSHCFSLIYWMQLCDYRHWKMMQLVFAVCVQIWFHFSMICWTDFIMQTKFNLNELFQNFISSRGDSSSIFVRFIIVQLLINWVTVNMNGDFCWCWTVAIKP